MQKWYEVKQWFLYSIKLDKLSLFVRRGSKFNPGFVQLCRAVEVLFMFSEGTTAPFFSSELLGKPKLPYQISKMFNFFYPIVFSLHMHRREIYEEIIGNVQQCTIITATTTPTTTTDMIFRTFLRAHTTTRLK
uniref:Uncharacterized protein n=1 Tax=Cannabis sativa TaxID=3483 RepID=A0A803R2X2_CANSA